MNIIIRYLLNTDGQRVFLCDRYAIVLEWIYEKYSSIS